MDRPSVIVSGATNQVGCFLLPRLLETGYEVHAISRKVASSANKSPDHVYWHQLDLATGWKNVNIKKSEYFIHLAPVWLFSDIIDDLSRIGIKRIIALSSTSRFSKQKSGDSREQETVKKLIKAEEELIARCAANEISWTLFRPTMIYGCGMDKNITMIAKLISRLGFFPLVDNGKGYRQPVHADDIAISCIAALNCQATCNHAYNLSGGQTLTFKEMVKAIFLALGKKPRFINLPGKLAVFLLTCASFIPAYRHINKEMLARVSQDICFDSACAQKDFSYSPRGFKYSSGIPIGPRGIVKNDDLKI